MDHLAKERVSLRQRPQGKPLMYQTWDKLLFLHWPIPAEQLRPHVPAGLELDTWDDCCWVGLTPLTIRGLRPRCIPAVPFLSETYELNFRTYVHHDGLPGVWFFSLDATNWAAVWGARLGFALPYFHAAIGYTIQGDQLSFHCARRHGTAPEAELAVSWTLGDGLDAAQPGTEEFYWIERYCLYSSNGKHLYRARIHHPPWPLRAALINELECRMFRSIGLSEPTRAPRVHAQALPLRVHTWAPERIA
ncbi:MAG: YqjF family protein [Pirellulaceae bacterium]